MGAAVLGRPHCVNQAADQVTGSEVHDPELPVPKLA